MSKSTGESADERMGVELTNMEIKMNHEEAKKVIDNLSYIGNRLRAINDNLGIIILSLFLIAFCVMMRSCIETGSIRVAHAAPAIRFGETQPLPPPLTEEEYLRLNSQQRYGACYPYCKEANQQCANEVWLLMNRVDELEAVLIRFMEELQICQSGKQSILNMQPAD